VLPFENLSDDPDNAYFADGIQEEILTRLASIADLRVISRTSTQRYHSKPGKLAEIAKQLNVANILEGSVQKTAEQVRVNVQLINAQTDSHLWADTYDQKLTDIFSVESQIAKGIAAALQAKLTGREEQTLAAKPTNNPEAYDAYLHGLALGTRPGPLGDLLGEVIDSYERAVQLDSNFAIAWAQLSNWHGVRYYNSNDPADRDAAKRSLEKAQELEPNSPEILLALGYYQYRVLRDYGAAKTTFGRVSELSPSSSDVPYALGRVARQAGHWDESIPHYERALSLDPRNVGLLSNAAATYGMLRQFPAALKLYDRILDIAPNDPDVMAQKVGIYQAQGNLQDAARCLSTTNEQTSSDAMFRAKMLQLRLERSYGGAIRLLKARLIQFHSSSEYAKADNQLDFALIQSLNGDTAGAKVAAGQARDALEPLYRDKPDDPLLTERLSGAYAWMGEKDLALNLAERAVVLRPRAKDAALGPTFEENLALIETICGDNGRAISALTQLLQIPYWGSLYDGVPITPALLRLDPIWDPLRSDPAFQKICEEKIEKSIAVLPFENLSDEKANVYFAEGIQDEILTRLSKIADLKVISRTSARQYQAKPENLEDIGKQLGVANILEGSVQKVANAVHVNVQLIRAATDEHLWAESYNRTLDDVFGVEGEVANAIADQLNAKLTGAEQNSVAEKPTQNAAAYDIYLRAVAIDDAITPDTTKRVTDLYAEAVALDPQFALAWARLAVARSYLYFTGMDLETNSGAAVKEAADHAMSLQPELGEAWLAQGVYRYRVLRDFQGALESYKEALRRLPNSAFVLEQMAHLERRLGQFDVAQKHYQAAAQLDPRNVGVLSNVADTLLSVRRFDEARTVLDRVIQLSPGNEEALSEKAFSLQSQGRLSEAAEVLAKTRANSKDVGLAILRSSQLYLERRFDTAIIQIQQNTPTAMANDPRFMTLLGLCQKFAGKDEEARATFTKAVAAMKPTPDSAVVVDSRELPCYLPWVYAGLGEKEQALEQAHNAIADYDNDAIVKPFAETSLAIVQAQTGDTESAIAALPHLLEVPNGETVGDLRTNPLWDPLRKDPRFQELCQEKQP
jgi:TolB-like protein/Tfp pilus assembly protein PilF